MERAWAVTVLLALLVVTAGCGDTGESAQPTEPTATPAATTIATTTTPTAPTTSPTATTTTSTVTPTTTTTPSPVTTTSTSTATSTTTEQTRTSWSVTVVRIIDGDTLEVEFPDGRTEDVRLLGVDTPEVHTENDPEEFEGVPDTDAGRDWLRDWGHKASEFARTELRGEEITIQTDPQSDRRGSYGRLLVYVETEDGLFNLKLIQQGYARMYDSSFSERAEFADAEQHAQNSGIGLWGFESATTTTTTTTTTNGGEEGELTVAEIHADAEGNDHENENDEYIVFENTGGASLDLSGWRVEDEADHTYYFPDGFTLAAGAQVTLYTGSGDDTETELYWGSDSAIWNNNGDTIIVTDDDGNEVLRESYEG